VNLRSLQPLSLYPANSIFVNGEEKRGHCELLSLITLELSALCKCEK